MNLYLYESHSYYNRKIVRYHNIDEYERNLGPSTYIANDISFNPNDSVYTSQIVNYPLDHPYFEGTAAPSYCLVVDDTENIVSRWWITNHTRIRKGQANLSLLRDVIADYYDEVMSAPSFIRKGYLNTTNDPAIYNNEDMGFNQIKTAESELRDKSGAAWYVAYISKDLSTKQVTIESKAINTTASYTSWSQYPYYKYSASNPYIGDYTDITFQLYGYNTQSFIGGLIQEQVTFRAGWDENGRPKMPPVGNGWEDYSRYLGTGFVAKTNYEQGFMYDPEGRTNTVFEAAGSIPDWRAGSYAITGAHTANEVATFLAENGRFIRVGGKAYKIRIVSYVTTEKTVEIPNANIYANKFRAVATNSGAFFVNQEIKGNFSAISYTTQSYYVLPEEVEETGFSFTIPEIRQHTAGVPYDIIAVPATPVWIGDEETSTSASFSQAVINAINTDLVTGENAEIYDIQLLPYCPLADEFLVSMGYDSGRILTSKMKKDQELVQYEVLRSEGNSEEKTIILYAENAEFEKTINTAPIAVPTDPLEFKVANETNIYRLCSPNYNGQFEFSATKNGGVSRWDIAFTYKPYTPYIRIAPKFGRLYGNNFGDARGLILGGDFSIAQTNDAWLSYELQNKNYQVMFDRQITNMEFNNRLASYSDFANALTGTASGVGTGMIAGTMATKNPYIGAAIAAGSGLASLGGGITDMLFNSQQRREQMSLTKDMFGYQLGTIKALPYSLTKVGAQNADFKYFPFVEYYTSTEIEKQALRSKITWNGMTIMRIGQIQNFLQTRRTEAGTFIQANPIRFDGITEDSHLAETIAAELNTGVYII